MRLVLLALFNRALVAIHVGHGGEALATLSSQIAIGHGMTDDDRRPSHSFRSATTRRDTGLLPQPVRTAHTEITGTAERSWVRAAPSNQKSAPAAVTRDARC